MDFKNIEKQGERKIYLPNSGKQPFSHTLKEHMNIFSILHRLHLHGFVCTKFFDTECLPVLIFRNHAIGVSWAYHMCPYAV